MSSFYLTLPSSASMTEYPDNKQSNFTTVLANEVVLNSNYEVALTQMLYSPYIKTDVAEISATLDDGDTNKLETPFVIIQVNNGSNIESILQRIAHESEFLSYLLKQTYVNQTSDFSKSKLFVQDTVVQVLVDSKDSSTYYLPNVKVNVERRKRSNEEVPNPKKSKTTETNKDLHKEETKSESKQIDETKIKEYKSLEKEISDTIAELAKNLIDLENKALGNQTDTTFTKNTINKINQVQKIINKLVSLREKQTTLSHALLNTYKSNDLISEKIENLTKLIAEPLADSNESLNQLLNTTKQILDDIEELNKSHAKIRGIVRRSVTISDVDAITPLSVKIQDFIKQRTTDYEVIDNIIRFKKQGFINFETFIGSENIQLIGIYDKNKYTTDYLKKVISDYKEYMTEMLVYTRLKSKSLYKFGEKLFIDRNSKSISFMSPKGLVVIKIKGMIAKVLKNNCKIYENDTYEELKLGYNTLFYPNINVSPIKYAFIYSNIVEDQLLGNVSTKILSVVPITSSDNGGHVVSYVENPNYVPVCVNSLNTINIAIKDVNGDNIKFDDVLTNTVIKLHFRSLRE